MTDKESPPLIPPDAPWKVIKHTALIGSSGAIVGSFIGLSRSVQAIPYAFNVAISTSIFAFTYFSFREYMMVPLNERLRLHASDSLATRGVLESASAGAASGGLLLSYRFGPRRFLSGALTTAILTSAGQFLLNGAQYARIEYLSKKTASHVENKVPKKALLERLVDLAPIRKLSPEEAEARKARMESQS